MHKIRLSSIFFRYSLTSAILLTTLSAELIRPVKTLAECTPSTSNCEKKTDNSSCDSRNPYNLVADTTRVRRIKITWDVCQKNDFYQVSWGNDKDDMTQIDDPTARSWTYAGARDLVKYIFKVRGCNARPTPDTAQEPDCTPWAELLVTTPDW
ncbi:hypothetical protein FD723_05075 [Nostoc sp. C052]|uniref:hypothetical protein n=1 Tax=Nostoc sp. C052 TaxID=2576902 RepID=UPI0015C3F4FF|nr:hypothetical protein [Nostoc sp. C052]QLE39911.1 hypothetical protein FD723_05075 [Nostoc sp. C052]